MWHVLVVYPMNLHVVVAVDTCTDKIIVMNIVLMYQESSACVQRTNLVPECNSEHLKSLFFLPKIHTGTMVRLSVEYIGP